MKTIYLRHPHMYEPVKKEKLAMALGFFDGVHKGHQAVITEAISIAKKRQWKSAVMTFFPHPSVILKKDQHVVQYITPLQEKLEELEKLGVDYAFVVDFTPEFSQLSPQQFVDEYIIKLQVEHVVAGFDYSYGKLGKGTMETLPFHSRNCFTQTVISRIDKGEEKVSSSWIRQLLQAGNLEEVTMLLGRPLMMRGKVIHGDKRGRTIGFPTANVELHSSWLLPPKGVYAVRVGVGNQWYEGMCNIGYKPTFYEEGLRLTVEAHLFKFDGDIYDEVVEIQWHTRIRDEQKFSGIEGLVAQLQQDKAYAEKYFSEMKQQLAISKQK